jgi:hypothetical protein
MRRLPLSEIRPQQNRVIHFVSICTPNRKRTCGEFRDAHKAGYALSQPKESRLKTRDLRFRNEKRLFGNDTVALTLRRSLKKVGLFGQ